MLLLHIVEALKVLGRRSNVLFLTDQLADHSHLLVETQIITWKQWMSLLLNV